MSKPVSVDDAVAGLVAEAEAHESEHNGGFCPHTRTTLVVYVMLRLGLSLEDLDTLAVELAHALDVNEENLAEEAEAKAESWPAEIKSE
jgi:hypothetical protein